MLSVEVAGARSKQRMEKSSGQRLGFRSDTKKNFERKEKVNSCLLFLYIELASQELYMCARVLYWCKTHMHIPSSSSSLIPNDRKQKNKRCIIRPLKMCANSNIFQQF